MTKTRIMIAGIGGASLGTEIAKSLRLAGGYAVFGCDISPTAYGLYQPEFDRTWRVDPDRYIPSVLAACKEAQCAWLIPGAEKTMVLLNAAKEQFRQAGIELVGNAPEVVVLCSDKAATFAHLATAGIPSPRTSVAETATDLERVGLPCIVKPATDSGGSASVFFSTSTEEALVYTEFIRRNGGTPIAQEYIDIKEGEFTIGVLSLPDGSIAGSIALRRALEAKLSVLYRGRGGVISSGYSQGYIDDFPELRRQAETIAKAVGSRGPVNVQGRVRDGVLYPFEINPRFSASTHLRSLAGFNELDIFLTHLDTGARPAPPAIRPGWYLRSLTEQYVAPEQVK